MSKQNFRTRDLDDVIDKYNEEAEEAWKTFDKLSNFKNKITIETLHKTTDCSFGDLGWTIGSLNALSWYMYSVDVNRGRCTHADVKDLYETAVSFSTKGLARRI